MMATTHAFAGAAVAVALARVAPELAPLAVAAGLVGGLFPDFDLYVGHRRTLHYPVLYWIPAVAATGAAVVRPGLTTLPVAAFLLAAALHSSMDALGGGLELRPWKESSERAVYDHYRGRWLQPRRWIRYDGAPEDVLLGGMFAVPVVTVVDGSLALVVVGAVGVSAAYALVRKRVPSVTETVFSYVPEPMLAYVPDRFLDG